MMSKLNTTSVSLLGLLLAFTLLAVSCENDAAVPMEQSADDFEAFYHQFLTDEDYQMAHIVFPLEGIPAGVESEAEMIGFKWQPEDWMPHRPMDPIESGFESEFVELEPGLMVERIVHHSGSYGMMRRFARFGNEWYLIYYAGMNAI